VGKNVGSPPLWDEEKDKGELFVIPVTVAEHLGRGEGRGRTSKETYSGRPPSISLWKIKETRKRAVLLST